MIVVFDGYENIITSCILIKLYSGCDNIIITYYWDIKNMI